MQQDLAINVHGRKLVDDKLTWLDGERTKVKDEAMALRAMAEDAMPKEPRGRLDQFANDMADAIDKFVKTGKVETEDGQKPVR